MAKKGRLDKAKREKVEQLLLTWPYGAWDFGNGSMSVADAAMFLQALAAMAHITWCHNVREGRISDEDVSPAEGLLKLSYLVRYFGDRFKVRKVPVKGLVDQYHKLSEKKLDEIEKRLFKGIDEIAPGYLRENANGDEEGK